MSAVGVCLAIALSGLPVGRVPAAPAAVLLELDAVRRVPLRLLGLVVAPLALGAGERDPNSDSGCHLFSSCSEYARSSGGRGRTSHPRGVVPPLLPPPRPRPPRVAGSPTV